MPRVQFTNWENPDGKIMLDIDSSDVRSVHDMGEYRILNIVFSFEKGTKRVSTGVLSEYFVTESYDYVLNVCGIKNVIGS